MEVLLAAVVGLVVGSGLNRLVIREPGYVIRDVADAPDATDEELAELEEVGALPPVPVLALVRPGTWARRWFPAVEVVTAGAWALTVDRYGVGAVSVVVLFVASVLVAVAAIDFRVLRIPDRINFPAMGITLALIAGVSTYRSDVASIQGAIYGGAGYAGMLLLAHLVYPKGMGWGDVKLAWLMGFVLGWFGWLSASVDFATADLASIDGRVSPVLGVVQFVIWGFGLGSILGLVVSLPYAIARRSARTSFPFGPSLAAGCLLVVWFAGRIQV